MVGGSPALRVPSPAGTHGGRAHTPWALLDLFRRYWVGEGPQPAEEGEVTHLVRQIVMGVVIGLAVLVTALIVVNHSGSSDVDKYSYTKGYDAFGGALVRTDDRSREQVEVDCDSLSRRLQLMFPGLQVGQEGLDPGMCRCGAEQGLPLQVVRRQDADRYSSGMRPRGREVPRELRCSLIGTVAAAGEAGTSGRGPRLSMGPYRSMCRR